MAVIRPAVSDETRSPNAILAWVKLLELHEGEAEQRYWCDPDQVDLVSREAQRAGRSPRPGRARRQEPVIDRAR
jgi:hypothetical protein